MAAGKPIQAPKGTRDLYPLEAARRRWLTELWRQTSLRHGFEEVDGPTFETTDLYAVKSGEGILGELFQAFSGKDEKQIEAIRAGGAAPFALRPEFTPTLARMYAARANSLTKPTKWFSVGPFFRAERPQRGRLREFLQWNVDVLGLDVPEERWNAEGAEESAEVAEAKARMDAECIGVCIGMLEAAGLGPEDCRIRYSDRSIVSRVLTAVGVSDVTRALTLLDKRSKLSEAHFQTEAQALNLFVPLLETQLEEVRAAIYFSGRSDRPERQVLTRLEIDVAPLRAFHRHCDQVGVGGWLELEPSIVRGLAYYTGTVFEVVAEGERAVAGGGRYDNLVELFGGPPTPAVGFAMGDVVISLLLQDKGLMPSDAELMAAAGARPDVFVISANEDLDAAMHGLLARLRREGLHARRSYRSTRNVGKLLKEASNQHARLALVIESSTDATVKPLDGGDQERLPLEEAVARVHEWARAMGNGQ